MNSPSHSLEEFSKLLKLANEATTNLTTEEIRSDLNSYHNKFSDCNFTENERCDNPLLNGHHLQLQCHLSEGLGLDFMGFLFLHFGLFVIAVGCSQFFLLGSHCILLLFFTLLKIFSNFYFISFLSLDIFLLLLSAIL